MFLTLYNLNNSSIEHENSSFCSFFSTCYSLDALFCLCCRKQNMFSSVSDRKWNVVPVSSEPPTTWQISQIIAKNMKIRCFVLKLNSAVSEEIHTLFFPSLHKLNQSSCLFCRRGWGAFSAADRDDRRQRAPQTENLQPPDLQLLRIVLSGLVLSGLGLGFVCRFSFWIRFQVG